MVRLDLVDFSGRLFSLDHFLQQDVRFRDTDREKLLQTRGLPFWWPLRHATTLRSVFYTVTGLPADYMALAEYYTTLKRRERLVHDDETEEDCNICTKPLDKPDEESPAERAVTLTCGHVFGERCLAEWISVFNGLSHACPLCRKAIWLAPTDRLKQVSRNYQLPRMVGDSEEDMDANDAHGRFFQTYHRATKILQALTIRLTVYRATAAGKDDRTRKAMIDDITHALVLCCKKPSRGYDDPLVLKNSDGTVMTVLDACMRMKWVNDKPPNPQDPGLTLIHRGTVPAHYSLLRNHIRELESFDNFISFLRLDLRVFDDRMLEASLSFSYMFLLMPADMRAELATASLDSYDGGLQITRERAHKLASDFENDAKRALKALALAAEHTVLYLPGMALSLEYAIERLADLSSSDRRLLDRVHLSIKAFALETRSCRERSEDLAIVVRCIDGIFERLAPDVTRDEYEDALARLRQEGIRVLGLEEDGTPRFRGWIRELREPVRSIVGRQSTPYAGASPLLGVDSI